MDSHFSDIISLVKNRQKSYSFAAHFEHHFDATASRTDLCKYMTFKVVKQIKPIGPMKTFRKPYRNLCMEEHLLILKKYVTNALRLLTRYMIYTGTAVTKQLYIDFPDH